MGVVTVRNRTAARAHSLAYVRALHDGLGWSWAKILRLELRGFIRATRRGSPYQCHQCGRRLAVGQMIERVRVAALPWQHYRHQVCAAPYTRKPPKSITVKITADLRPLLRQIKGAEAGLDNIWRPLEPPE